jgi:hypothetical protein
MSAYGELPLRIVNQPGGAVVRCLCGRELASIRRGSTANLIRQPAGRSQREARAISVLSPDLTVYGLAIMTAHALTCTEYVINPLPDGPGMRPGQA